MAQASDKRTHLVLENTATAQRFTAFGGGGSTKPPWLDPQQHGVVLRAQLDGLRVIAAQAAVAQESAGLQGGIGLQIQFVGIPGIELAFESLSNERGRDQSKHIDVLSVRVDGNTTTASVFVPDGKLSHFEKYVAEYLQGKRNVNNELIDHSSLFNTVAAIRTAEIRALWTDDPASLPEDDTEMFWWEAWLPVRGRGNEVVADFRKLATLAECRVSEHQINFPERTVLLLYGSQQQLKQSAMILNCVAELRRAKDTADFFDGMTPPEQLAWVEDAVTRLRLPSEGETTPRVCLLDSGVNRGHPLLAPLIASEDLHTVNPAWGTNDQANHGSGIAGLVAFGDLTDALASTEPIVVSHRLESVNLTPIQGANQGDAKLHGYLFSDAVSRPEISAPSRPRVFTSAVTSSDGRDRGRPSAWSATIDRLASDFDNDGQFRRLFVLAAGNTFSESAWSTYPASLTTNGIRDPAQSWNAVTVGAFTLKTHVADANGYDAIAASGALSPYTSTSGEWDSAWTLKPDVVFEGGNAGKNVTGAAGISSLHLLTTNNLPTERLLTTTNATSAASALCARMAGQLMSAYPKLKPETIRALLVHSAEWTPAMLDMYPPSNPRRNKRTQEDTARLIRHCGWGTPSLDRALWSASNSLTLIAEDRLQPYEKERKKGVVTRDMNLHALPWPKEALLALPSEAQVELRVTLSYFVEPNPSARGTTSKFRYPSHRLKFDVQRPLDASTDEFIARINSKAEREEEIEPANSADSNWCLGSQQRHRGSLHQDIWKGSGAELAAMGFIAVYPGLGWWRTRPALERYDQPARYSLVLSIRTPETNVDLYTAVAQQIATQIAVPITV